MIMGRGLVNRLLALIAAAALAALPITAAQAEDGYDLWLRHAPLEGAALERLRAFDVSVSTDLYDGEDTAILDVAERELLIGLDQLMDDAPIRLRPGRSTVDMDCGPSPTDGDGSFSIKSSEGQIDIRGPSHISCLYGAYALLRELSLGADPRSIDIVSAPAMPLRMLNHWDNPDGTVERGYSGRSIFDWWHLPERLDQRMIDYARANASIGINGVVVNNVNASPLFLTDRYLRQRRVAGDAGGMELRLHRRRDCGGGADASWWPDAAARAVP
jgi:alpha-glucuronidase